MYRWRRTIVVVLMVALVALVVADIIVGLGS
jgi:preprotein translocase subunit SecE